MIFKKDEIIFLLGAGASFEAGIPIAPKMIEEVEELIQIDTDWQKFKELYFLVKSAIIYADGIQGKFAEKGNFNIERLFNVLIELEKKEEHPLYPFIGQWNIKFSEIVSNNFQIIAEFQKLILDKLKEWVSLEKDENANYYKALKSFKIEYNYPLRIFSLNYDLCVETSLEGEGIEIERGFDKNLRTWDYKRYDEIPEDTEPDIFLYKLHGSIDWERNTDTGEVKFKNINKINTPDLIFGNIYKLQYVDPYLFQFYELRKYSLQSKLIVVIGYSYSDAHINGILSQALRQDKERRILSISPQKDIKDDLLRILNQKPKKKIEIREMGAKEFFNNSLKLETLESIFPDKTTDEIWS